MVATPDASATPADAPLTTDAATQVTFDARDSNAPASSFARPTDDLEVPGPHRRRRRSPGPHERNIPGVLKDGSANDSDGNPWPLEEARLTEYALTD